MPEKEIYKCAECGGEITDKMYLRSVREHGLKFCSSQCTATAWRRGIYEYNKGMVKRVKRKKAITTAVRKTEKPVAAAKQDKPTVKNMRNVSSLVGKRGKALTPEQKSEIIKLYKQGYNRRQISIATERSYNTVKRIIDLYKRGESI